MNPEKLKYLISEDLFESELVQVFCAKTGKQLGAAKIGEEINFKISDETTRKIEQENPNQIKLF